MDVSLCDNRVRKSGVDDERLLLSIRIAEWFGSKGQLSRSLPQRIRDYETRRGRYWLIDSTAPLSLLILEFCGPWVAPFGFEGATAQ